MSSKSHSLHRLAVRRLLTATFFWGFSFIMMKSLMLVGAAGRGDGSSDSWFITGAATGTRFLIAAIILGIFGAPKLARLTRLEFYQGAGLGLSAGGGMLFQMDGIGYTSASTSAFLTQTYCVILPLIVAWRDRAWPRPRIWASCAMVFVGVAILGRIDFSHFHLGRGEWETLAGSLIFAGQILWLERPLFRENDVANFSVIMFLCIALACLPVALWHGSGAAAVALAGSWKFWLFTAVLVGPCTLFSFLTMNKWQPHVPATEAALIYGVEPVWASLFALFLPGLVSSAVGLDYPNESATWFLMAGGGLIFGANILIQTGPRNRT